MLKLAEAWDGFYFLEGARCTAIEGSVADWITLSIALREKADWCANRLGCRWVDSESVELFSPRNCVSDADTELLKGDEIAQLCDEIRSKVGQ